MMMADLKHRVLASNNSGSYDPRATDIEGMTIADLKYLAILKKSQPS